MKSDFKSPAVSWYPKDHLASSRVAEMPIEVEGYYRRALDHAWLSDGLPNDPARVAAIVGKGCSRDAAESILQMFVVDKKDATKVRSERQEIERKKQRENSKKRKEAGRLSGVKRREKRDLTREQTLEQNANKNEHSDSVSDSDSDSDFLDFQRLKAGAASAHAGSDQRVVETAVLETLIKWHESQNPQKRPIKSAAYFNEEIVKCVSDSVVLTSATIDTRLMARRQKFKEIEKRYERKRA